MRIRIQAVPGRQGGHDCWATMLPVRAYLQMTDIPDQDVSPEEKAQRDLSEARSGKLADYLLQNHTGRVLSAVTLLAQEWSFDAGMLELPLDPSRVAIADGQHRRRALELAVQTDRGLLDESIPATIFPAVDLERAREVFVAINSGAPVPTTIRTFYQPGDKQAVLDAARREPFVGLIEFVKPNPSPRSGRIWSLTAMCRTKGVTDASWWSDVLSALPGYSQVRVGNLSAKEVRETYVWAHGVGLEALGQLHGKISGSSLQGLPDGFWRRNDPRWLNRCTDGTRMLTGTRSVSGIAAEVTDALTTSGVEW